MSRYDDLKADVDLKVEVCAASVVAQYPGRLTTSQKLLPVNPVTGVTTMDQFGGDIMEDNITARSGNTTVSATEYTSEHTAGRIGHPSLVITVGIGHSNTKVSVPNSDLNHTTVDTVSDGSAREREFTREQEFTRNAAARVVGQVQRCAARSMTVPQALDMRSATEAAAERRAPTPLKPGL
jgi:hypothetical protein